MTNQEIEKRIRVLLLVEHGLFGASLARLLASEPGFEVVGETGTSGEALELLNRFSVDVVLLDFELPERTGDLIATFRTGNYQGKLLIVAGTADPESSAIALKLGASGIFLKSEAPDRLLQAIRLVAAGGFWIDQKIVQLLADRCISRASRQADPKSGDLLAEREQRVVLGILGGLTNKKIAMSMGLSESSVKNIVLGLFSKGGVRTRSQLVRRALEGSLGNVRQFVNRQEKGPGRHSADSGEPSTSLPSGSTLP